jgi:hypothetical protein
VRRAIAVLLFLFPFNTADAGELTLAWDPRADANVAGYRVYVGESSRSYHATLDVGASTQCVVGNLEVGRIYYFAVTAYDASGAESGFSREVTAMLGGATLPSTVTFALSPQDTSLNVDSTNYSSRPKLMTYTWPDQQPANAILMQFDLSAVPASAVVDDATLHLRLIQSDGAPESDYAVSAHKIVGRRPLIASATGYTADGVNGWTPNACCYNSVPLAQADVTPAYDTRAIDKTPKFKTWTITSMAEEWLADPGANAGLLLNSDASALRDRYRYFASMEHPDANLRPFLRVAYSLPPPAAEASAATVALTPRDTSLNIDRQNYSADPVLMTYTWPDQQRANAILMQFDLSAIPPGAVVSDATLQLELVGSDAAADATYTVTAHKVTGRSPVVENATGHTADGVTEWTPNACCHQAVPLAQADLSAAYAATAIDQSAGARTWTVTRMVQEWLAAPGTNFGLVLNSDASKPRDRFRYFASMEHPIARLRPFLRVTYSRP